MEKAMGKMKEEHEKVKTEMARKGYFLHFTLVVACLIVVCIYIHIYVHTAGVVSAWLARHW